MITAPDDRTAIFVAIIAAMAVIIAALIAAVFPVLFSIRRHAKVTREEVTNDHDTNLRVEADERHAQNVKAIASLRRLVYRQGTSINGRIDRITDRLEIVEDTIPIKRRKQ